MSTERTLNSPPNEGVSHNPPSTPRRRCPSPSGPGRPGKRSCYSPPPPPCHYARRIGDTEPNAVAVLLDLNSGRSMLEKVGPLRAFDLDLPRKALHEEFTREEEDERSISPFHIDSGGSLKFGLPPYPLFPSRVAFLSGLIGKKEEEENDDNDMPCTISPVRLRMRSNHVVSPVARRMEKGGQLACSFVSVKSEPGDKNDGKSSNGASSFFKAPSSHSAFTTR